MVRISSSLKVVFKYTRNAFRIFLSLNEEIIIPCENVHGVTKRKYTLNIYVFVEHFKLIQNKQRRKDHGYKSSDLNENRKHIYSCREYATISTNNVYGNFKSIYLLLIGNLL